MIMLGRVRTISVMFMERMRVRMVVIAAVAVRVGMIMRMAVRRAIRMGVFMLMQRMAFDLRLTFSTAAGRAHGSLHFQIDDAHRRAAGHLDRETTAMRTGIIYVCERRLPPASKTAPFAWSRDHFEPRAFRDALPHRDVETELEGLALHPGERADLDAHRLHARETFTCRSLLDQLAHAFGEGHFMHVEILAVQPQKPPPPIRDRRSGLGF